jgi:hypothetical protein
MRRATVLALALAAQACAQGPGASAAVSAAPALFAKAQWTVARGWCPVGCSPATLAFVQGQAGQAVKLAATRMEAPFLDPCEGTVRFDDKPQTGAQVVAVVNQGLAPGHRRLAPADIGLSEQGTTRTAVALCRGPAGEMSMARLLSVEPDRVLVLFEEQSVLELR